MMLLTVIMAFAGAQTATAAVGDVVATGYCGTTANGADGHNLAWTLTENGEDDIEISSGTYTALTLTITGTGAMDDYTNISPSPWNETNNYRNRVTKLVLPEGITHIGNYAFYFTNFTGKLTIPSTVQTIGTSGFYCFYSATSVTIPASVTSIGEKGLQAFGKNASSCTVTFAEGSQLASIGANAFERVNADLDLRNCTQLTAITAEEVFKGYNKTVTFPRTMTSVCANAFKKATGGDNPKVKLSYKGFLVINGVYQSYNANGAVSTITSKFEITTRDSKAVTIRQGVIDGLTWNTEGKYYEINDEQDLIDLGLYVIADRTNDCAGLTFKMTADLDFSKMANDERCKDKLGWGTGNFLPIGLSGGSTSGGAGFAGSFYGQGHSITGLRYNYPSVGVGLFGEINGSAVVDGVTLISPTFRANGDVGGIVGTMYGGTVSNCAVVNGSLDGGSGNSVGGIVGYSYSGTNTISGCTVVGTSVSSSNINFDGIIFGYNGADTLSISGCTYHTATGLPVCGHTSSFATTTESDNTRVYQLTIGEGITASGATYSHVLVPDKAYYANGSTVTLGHGTREGYVFDGYTASPAQTISDGTFTMPAEDVTVGATWTIDPAHFSVNGEGTEYTIHTATGWGVFCDCLDDNDTYNRFSGKTVKLGADITVSRMAGSDHHDFCGTFDGQGHTLTVSYSGSSYVAPFSYVDGATIQNLVVEGTISSSGTRAAGVIGETGSPGTTGKSYITNCVSSSTITGGNYSGGFSIGGNVEIEGCVFNGIINSDDNSGGFVGYSQSALTITNSLFAPQSGSSAKGTFYYNGTAGTLTNCYYTQTLGEGQGKQARTIAAGEGVTLGHDGVATEYSVSGITAYKASDAHGDNDPFIDGLVYNEVLYAGSGDEVSLTLTNSSGDAPLGYKNGDYSVTGGATLSGSTLTMADDNVTVSFTPGDQLRSTGQAVPVTYIDADGILCDGQDGRPDPANAIALDGTESSLGQDGQETWYFVGADISYGDKIDCNGDVNIILADGKTMTVTSNSEGIKGINGSLTIYGQTLGTGILNATCTNYGIFHYDGNVVICGGTVNATGTNSTGIYTDGIVTINGGTVNATGNSNGIYAGGDVTITGGKVTATGNVNGINAKGGDVTITGGKVTANGNNEGIFAGGDITLGWTNATDFIKASSYAPSPDGGVNIADDQTLYDEDGNEYSGDRVDSNDLAGKTLRPYDCRLALSDDADNTADIAAANGKVYNVTLSGRTLYKDGDWNTLCLPFSVGDEEAESGHELDGTPLEGATLMTLGNSPACNTGFDPQTGTLNLEFLPATTVEPGVAYIVKWPIPDAYDLKNPVFTGVTVTNDAPADHATTSTDGYVTFVGTYGPADIYTDPAVNLYLGAANTLYYPSGKNGPITIGSFRAYFQLNNGLTAGTPSSPKAVRAFSLNFGDENTTGIISIENGKWKIENSAAAAWYDLQGRKLSAQPTARGIYIHGGKKVIIK